MTIAQTGRFAISAIGVCVAAMLAACGGPLTASGPASPAQTGAVSQARLDAGSGCPLKRCIIVTSEIGDTNEPLPAVLFFAKGANGNVSPAGEITGPKTMLGSIPGGLVMDSRGNIYVANNGSSTITVYAAGAEGNVAPIRTISGTKTGLNRPTGLAIDSHDRLYVANSQSNTVTIYAPNANGDVAPARTIGGKNTDLYSPWGLAFDSRSNLYVADDNLNNGWITVYAPSAKGDEAPERTIKGSATKLVGPAGLAVDASGYIYAVNSQEESISIFSPNANGDEAPVSYFSAPIYAFGIGLDGHANMYVTSVGYDDPPSVTAFAAGTVGNEGRILRMIEGRKTRLILPRGLIVR